jgi:NADPH-dependent curcumin reductase CurA
MKQLEATRVVFKGPVDQGPVPPDTFITEKTSVDPALADGAVLLKLLWVSVDPYMRNRMYTTSWTGWPEGFTPGEPFVGGTVAQVTESKDPELNKGDVVVGYLPWCTYAIVNNAKKVGTYHVTGHK